MHKGKISVLYNLCCTILDLVEIAIPAIMLLCLFVSFIAGIVFRYLLRDPQAWTFELSTVAFLQLTILSACYVQREDQHIAFDMIYERMSLKAQCLMRIIGNIVVVFTATMLIPAAIKYVGTMADLSTQVLKWPRWAIFVCLPLTFLIMDIRAGHRAVLDIGSYLKGTYKKEYPKTKGAKL